MPSVVKQANVVKARPKSESVLDRIGDIEADAPMRMLVYGDTGKGKTTFWGTFPGRTLAVLCSGGRNPGELKSLNTPEHRKRIKQVALRSSDEMREIVEHVRESGEFDNIVLDHASGFQDLVLKELLGLDEIPVQKSFGLASQQTYAQVAQMCKEYWRAMMNLPVRVVFVAHQRTFGGRDEGSDPDLVAPTVGAGLTPSLCGWLNGACDYIVQCYVRPRMEKRTTSMAGKSVETTVRGKGVEYCLRTGPHDVYYTKFRLPKGTPLPECVVDPTYEKVLALSEGRPIPSGK